MQIDPQRILDHKPLRCPTCGAACFSEPITGTSQADRYSVECTCCGYREKIEIDKATGAARNPPEDPPQKRKKSAGTKERAVARGRCILGGCEWKKAEAGLCATHLACWRAAGSPADIEAWAKERSRADNKDRKKTARRG